MSKPQKLFPGLTATLIGSKKIKMTQKYHKIEKSENKNCYEISVISLYCKPQKNLQAWKQSQISPLRLFLKVKNYPQKAIKSKKAEKYYTMKVIKYNFLDSEKQISS